MAVNTFSLFAGAVGETFTYDIDWGDGTSATGLTPSSVTNGSEGNATVGTIDGSHVYADDGTYTVTVRLADNDMSGDFVGGVDGVDFVQQTFLVTVADEPPTFDAGSDQAASEGAVVSAGAISFNDLGTLDTHTATIEWGDGTATEAGVVGESPFGPPGSTAGANGTASGSRVRGQRHVHGDGDGHGRRRAPRRPTR